LQEEYAKVEPKVAEGTVTIEEANHLHSLETRAHGHTEKGGLTAKAQSIATKRESQNSLGGASKYLEKLVLGSKADEKADSVTGEDEGKEFIIEQPFTGTKDNRTFTEAI
jgi:hypothetical protein